MRVCLTLLLVVVCAFAFAPGASAAEFPDCDETSGPPCFVSITKNGTAALEQNPILDTGVEVITGQTYLSGGARYWVFSIQDEHGDYNLNPLDTYKVVLDIGTANPGETFSRGQNVVIDRDLSSDPMHQTVTFTMNPVRVAYTDNGCHANGTCDMRADHLAPGYLEGWVDNLGFLTDPADEAAMQGWDLAASSDWVSSPPTLDYETHTFLIDVANAHCEEPVGPACTPFVGSTSMTFPFAMLSHLYEVDDPASLTASAFTVGGTGGATTTVTVDPGGHTVHVDITGITFSKHRLKVIGDMRPGGVRNLKAIRVSGTVGKLKFDPAKSRGSRVRGYKATCKSTSGLLASGRSDASPLKVTGLAPGVRHRCTVWAKSRFGRGAKRGADMPAH